MHAFTTGKGIILLTTKVDIMRWLFIIYCSCLITGGYAQDTSQHIVPGRFNSPNQQQKPYVILISADGFRYDFAKKYNATNLFALSQQGVSAASMQPSFPSLTFPNHYSIITGMYPSHHGLVNNSFYDETRKERYNMNNKKAVADSSWYGGTPLWVLAEQQQMLSASFYWVASETAIQGVKPTYYYVYNDSIAMNDRIAIVKNWLQLPEDKRPHLITFYFPQVDHEAHTYGPESIETAAAVKLVDDAIGKLVAITNELHIAVNFIFVSDHGMTAVDTLHTIPMPASIDTSKFIVPRGDVLVQLYAKDKNDINATYTALQKEAKDYDVYLSTAMPERWHYSKSDDRYNRLGDIVLIPRLPMVFSFNNKPPSPGKHGFDPALTDMQASFLAWGPQFKTNITIPTFENVHVYPLVANLLGLQYDTNIDGKASVLAPILK